MELVSPRKQREQSKDIFGEAMESERGMLRPMDSRKLSLMKFSRQSLKEAAKISEKMIQKVNWIKRRVMKKRGDSRLETLFMNWDSKTIYGCPHAYR